MCLNHDNHINTLTFGIAVLDLDKSIIDFYVASDHKKIRFNQTSLI